ncbi:MAG: hypothetical protein ABI862_07920 [Ilumatobacteraceae bacterium]
MATIRKTRRSSYATPVLVTTALVGAGGIAWYYFGTQWKVGARGMVSSSQQAQTLAIQRQLNHLADAPGSPCGRITENGHWSAETDRALECWVWLDNTFRRPATPWSAADTLANLPRLASGLVELAATSVPSIIDHLATRPWVAGVNGQPGHLVA